MQKFENMDVIAALEAIMHQNTAYYQSDFAYDIKMLRESARSDQPEDKLLLWLSRPSDRKSTRLNSSHANESRMPSSA